MFDFSPDLIYTVFIISSIGDEMKKITAILKSEIIIAAVSWLLSFIVMTVCWVARIKGSYLNYYTGIMITAFAAIFFTLNAIYAVVWLIKNTKKKRLLNYRDENGYSDEYFEALQDRLKTSAKFSAVFKNALLLCGEYADASRFDKALEAIRIIDGDRCNTSQKSRLASEYLKIYSLMKDEEKAKSLYIVLNEILFSAKLRDDVLAYAEYSKLLYFYLANDYEQAIKSASLTIKMSDSKKLKTDAGLMLALSSLKSGDKEVAKRYAGKFSKYISTPAQKENLLSLMTAIERAYGI